MAWSERRAEPGATKLREEFAGNQNGECVMNLKQWMLVAALPLEATDGLVTAVIAVFGVGASVWLCAGDCPVSRRRWAAPAPHGRTTALNDTDSQSTRAKLAAPGLKVLA